MPTVPFCPARSEILARSMASLIACRTRMSSNGSLSVIRARWDSVRIVALEMMMSSSWLFNACACSSVKVG